MKIKNAEILCVGTEILIGDIVNTNARFISERLALMGINQYYQAVVGDNPKRLKEAVTGALGRCDLLIMSGGLGPTYDDITKECVASCMGRELCFDEASFAEIKRFFDFRGKTMTENNKKQAYLPSGSTIFKNNAGTAPGCAVEDFENGKIVIMLPGPPFEMKRMWTESVEPYLGKFTENHFVSRNVNVFGIGESELESRILSLMEKATNPTIAPYCGDGEVRLRVTASAKTSYECEKAVNETVKKLYESDIGEYIYGIDTTLEEALVNGCKKANKTVSVAESCTGGLISKRITDVAGSSEMLGYGCVTYANEAKVRLLGVSEKTLAEYGAVSEQTASEMACGVRRLASSDIGIATTGIAGPGGGSVEKPVGLVYLGIATKNGVRTKKLMLNGDRERVRILASSNALAEALKELLRNQV